MIFRFRGYVFLLFEEVFMDSWVRLVLGRRCLRGREVFIVIYSF